MKNRIVITFCVIQLLILYSEAYSQNVRVNDRFTINVACNRFWQSDSTSFLEIATAFYPNQVMLTKDSIGYHGNVELRITIQKKSSGTLIHVDRYIVPVRILDTASVPMTKSIVSKIIYQLELGSYSIAVHGFNSSNRSRCDSSLFVVNILFIKILTVSFPIQVLFLVRLNHLQYSLMLNCIIYKKGWSI